MLFGASLYLLGYSDNWKDENSFNVFLSSTRFDLAMINTDLHEHVILIGHKLGTNTQAAF